MLSKESGPFCRVCSSMVGGEGVRCCAVVGAMWNGVWNVLSSIWLRVQEEKEEEKDEGNGVMNEVLVGATTVWTYREGGKAKYFSVATDLHMDEEMYDNVQEGKVLLLSDTKAAHLASELRHGDVVDFAQYRGCGAFVVEPVDASLSDFYLWKSLEEMGYGVPICFSDAPNGYYSNTELHYVFQDPSLIADPGHPIFTRIAETKKGVPLEGPPDWHTPVDPKTKGFPDKFVWFEDNLNGGAGWLSFDSFASQDFYSSKHYKIWHQRFDWKKRFTNRVTKTVCRLIFQKRLNLPAGVSDMISERACWLPYPVVPWRGLARGSKTKKTSLSPKKTQAPGLTKKKKKRGADEDEEDDWSP